MSRVAVVIPSWNTAELLVGCLSALARSSIELEVIVVDNASQDGSPERVEREFPRVRVLRNPLNEGFARACNQGVQACSAPFVLLLNSDAAVAPDAIERLLNFLEAHPSYAAAAPKLLNSDGTLQRACMNLPNWKTPLWFGTPLERWFPKSRELQRYFARDFDYEHDGDAVQPPAAALLLRRSCLDALAGFDESMWLYFNDVDLSLRLASAGWSTRFLPLASVVHAGGASTRNFRARLERWHLDRLHYYRKHHGRIAGVWVKACTSMAWLDFAWTCALAGFNFRGRSTLGAFGPTTRAFLRFLVA